ncbi:MAG: hypothetical protein K0Q79_2969 [Flavipsychrobacter sp.]|jgi:hypothetical protein|nr:hypothetical protein [Flavipsychrobacter sp.]
MRLSGLVLFSALITVPSIASAQDVREAFDLSNTAAQGSARSMGFGNTLGSVGGDFTSLSVNPAGLGVYRSSELSITPSLRVNSSSSTYTGMATRDINTRLNLNHIAFVFTNAPKGRRYEKRDWKAVSFAFGMNRIADFNRNYTYSGNNNTSSATQVFEADANMFPDDPVSIDASSAPGYIGYQSYLLNKDGNGNYYSIVPFAGGINQRRSVQERGRINEYIIALAGNYKEKLLLGVTIGVPSVKYNRNSYYTETIAANNTNNPHDFNSFTYSQGLSISGLGINAKLGAIYKFSDMFRAGLAFHTPTVYGINDVWDPNISAGAQGHLTTLLSGVDLVQNNYNYTVYTPWKGVASATLLLGKRGFITADYEYIDYRNTYYYFADGADAAPLNTEIEKTYQAVSNFRLGAEARLGEGFMVRGGFGYYGDPYSAYGKATKPAGYTTERIDASVGVGFRFGNFFTDIAYVRSMYQRFEQPYNVIYNDANGMPVVLSGTPATVPTATIDQTLNNIAWTVGLKF